MGERHLPRRPAKGIFEAVSQQSKLGLAYSSVMVTASRPSLDESPDSLYADELNRAALGRSFTSKLEADYVRSHLLDNRTLIRSALGLAALLLVLRGVEQTKMGLWNVTAVSIYSLIISSSIGLWWISYRPAFERLYLPWAQIIVPLRNAVVSFRITEFAAQGQPDLLMVLPFILIMPFFFLGMRFRSALLSGALSVAASGASAISFGLGLTFVLRMLVILLVALFSCVIAARQIEKSSRRGYLNNRLLTEMAQRDALTGVKNRRVFDERLMQLWKQALEQHHTIAILLFDIDHFKAYNDYYGHQAGDHALRQVAQAGQTCVRDPLDVFARYGGEEFAAILHDVDEAEVARIAEQMRYAVKALAIEHRGSGASTLVTVSVGAAVVDPAEARTPRGALQLADQALYEAKTKGRNRIEIMDETQYRMLVTGVFARDTLRSPVV